MKSINLKRIATATIGGALLAASVAAAVTVDDAGLAGFKLFNNAEPNVKIVVGASALPTDAVAAANIAAMIGNLAYTSSDISVLNKDGLSCTGGGTSGSTKVTATVTTPGVNPDIAYQMKTYLGDAATGGYLNQNAIDDRTDANSGSYVMPTESITTYKGRKVTNYESPLAYKGTITDSVGSKSYLEEEKYYFYAASMYDSTANAIQAKNALAGYEAVFTDPIVLCTNATTPSATDEVCAADAGSQYQTSKHRVKIKFLGADWVIYGLTGFAYIGSGGSPAVTLGKEVQYQEFMQIGDEATAPNGVKIVLKDISGMPYGTSYVPAASFDIYDASGNKIDTATLQETGTFEYNKNGVVIKIWKAFVGTGGSAYAQVSVFSDKLTLTSGSAVDTGDNKFWLVNIIQGGTSYGASLSRLQLRQQVTANALNPGDYVDIIRTPATMRLTYTGIETPASTDTLTASLVAGTSGGQMLYTSNTDVTTRANVAVLRSTRSNAFTFGTGGDTADTVYFVLGSEAGGAKIGQIYYLKNGYYVAYNGTTTSTVNGTVASGTAVALTGGSAWSILYAAGTSNNCSNNTGITAFSGTTSVVSSTSTSTANTINAAGNAVTFSDEQAFNTTFATGLVYTNASGTYECSGVATINSTTSNGTLTGFVITQFLQNYVAYSYGPNSVTVGFDATQLQTAACDSTHPNASQYALFVPEYTTDSDTGQFAFKVPIAGTTSTTQACFQPTSGTPYIGYGPHAAAAPNHTATNYQSGFTSRRGSVAQISSSTVSLTYPSTIVHALYTFGAASLNATSNSASGDYAEGATVLDTGGYKVVLDKIACGATSGADMTGADALACSSDSAYVVKALDTSARPLVVTDTSGMASGTETMILVGGPLVNTLTAQVPGFAAMNPGDSVVKVVGDKVVVAGYTAADTTAAANSLIEWLSGNKDAIDATR